MFSPNFLKSVEKWKEDEPFRKDRERKKNLILEASSILQTKGSHHTQVRECLYRGLEHSARRSYCALGVLGYECGIFDKTDNLDLQYRLIEKRFALDYTTRCPNCLKIGSLLLIIPHLNDDHRWTFKQIGEWLEKFGNMKE